MNTRLFLLLSWLTTTTTTAFTINPPAPDTEISEPPRLRFALAFPDKPAARRALEEALQYRRGAGKAIVTAAREAVREATEGGGWDNGPVRDAAPHAGVINRFIDPTNILTLST